MSARAVNRLLSFLTPVVLLAIWEGAARLGWIDIRFFSMPSAIFKEFVTMLESGELVMHTLISLERIFIGFTIGVLIGLALGLAIALMPRVAAILKPLVDATFPIPKVGLLPLVIILFGVGEGSKYAIIAIGVLYLILINTVAGVRQIERIYLDVGRNYHAGRLMMFTDVAFPGALPMIIAGMKISMGVSLILIVTAESLAAKSGIGFLIWTTWQVFEVEKMYVGLFMAAIIGICLTALLDWIEHVVVPWRQP
jgi:NitT/TauT family transport system permease protein